jgi:AcrR family transcriptional regulator
MGFTLGISEDAGQLATRRELLDAAGEVFAAAGFRSATVREICQRAGANIAAVNYHFGDKEQLYHAVLKDTYRTAVAKYPADFGLPAKATAEERLRAFVHSFLLRIFSEGPSARHGKLMAREMMEPTGALDEIVREEIRPLAGVLLEIIGELAGPDTEEETNRFCARSVVSQVLFYHHCRPVVTRLYPELAFDAAGLEKMADHITDFSVAAIKRLGAPSRKRGIRK